MFDGISLKRFQLVDGGDGLAQSLLHVLNFRTALVRVIRVLHEVQCGFKDVRNVEDRGIWHAGLACLKREQAHCMNVIACMSFGKSGKTLESAGAG